jgi:hypothetical protein
MLETTSFKRLILRAVLRQVSPMVIRLVSVSDQMQPPEFHEIFRAVLGWNGDLGYIVRVHGQEFNSFRRKTRSKALHEFKLHRQEKFLYVCDTLHLCEWDVRVDVSKQLESVKHLLWHGNTEEALERLLALSMDLSLIRAHSATAAKVADGVTEFETYIRNNREFIPNFGERRRQGETISTAFVESTINQVVSRRFVKKQQMVRRDKPA